MLNLCWQDLTIVALDIEATGPYPLEGEICEVAAVKWQGGEVVSEFQTLLKPNKPMSDFIIGIHGITNEMVADAPQIKDKVAEIREFVEGAVVIGHHSPFDVGFLTVEFERYGQTLPQEPVLCSSLISRKVIVDCENHRLQTLVKHLNLPQGSVHRALDDAKACLGVAIHCFEKLGEEKTLAEIMEVQEKSIFWQNYSLHGLMKNAVGKVILNAIEKQQKIKISYQGGSLKGLRVVQPRGVVRNPDGDFLAANDENDPQVKRFYLTRIKEALPLD